MQMNMQTPSAPLGDPNLVLGWGALPLAQTSEGQMVVEIQAGESEEGGKGLETSALD